MARSLKAFAAACALSQVQGANPLVEKVGMADPHIHYFNDTFVMFATHDFSVNNTAFLMKDWWIWTSKDLVSWEVASVVKPLESFTWAEGNENRCWATDGAFRDGRYYFYLSVGSSSIGIVTSESLYGPWTDALGEALLTKPEAKKMQTQFRDPSVFEDDDGQWYFVSGLFNYYIARLNDDMVSFAENLTLIEVNEPYSPLGWNKTDDKPFLHKHEGLYYLSWGCFYAISDSVYGPYNMTGSVIDTARIVPALRMNNSVPIGPNASDWYQGDDYRDRHGSFVEHQGQWYFSSNDRSHSGDLGHEGYFRDSVLCYVHYRADGTIEPCDLDLIGVGNYDASKRIEAENYFSLSTGSKVDLRAVTNDKAAGFGVQFNHGTFVSFPHVRGLDKVKCQPTLALLFAANQADGRLIVDFAMGSENKQVVCPLSSASGSSSANCALPDEITNWEDVEIAMQFSAADQSSSVLLDAFEILPCTSTQMVQV